MPLGQAMSSTASHGSRATVVGVSLTEPAILTPATWLGRAARASSGRRLDRLGVTHAIGRQITI
jgi:hypothetical protein